MFLSTSRWWYVTFVAVCSDYVKTVIVSEGAPTDDWTYNVSKELERQVGVCAFSAVSAVVHLKTFATVTIELNQVSRKSCLDWRPLGVESSVML